MHFTKAGDFYQRSVDTWNKIPHPARNNPNGFRAGDPRRVARELYNTNLQLTRLSSWPK